MNRLDHRQEFESVLSVYQLSSSAKAILSKLSLVLLSGPSASGRNTIIEELVKKGDYQEIVSDTTRKPRFNNGVKEINGQTYWFRDEESFLADLKKGAFLEAEIIHNQQVSGISIRELIRAQEANKVAITEVEIGGFLKILDLKPDTLGIFVLPPSFDIWLARLKNRNKISDEEMINRLTTGLRIYKTALDKSGIPIVVNDDLTVAVSDIDKIVLGRANHRQQSHKLLLDELILNTQKFLKDNLL